MNEKQRYFLQREHRQAAANAKRARKQAMSDSPTEKLFGLARVERHYMQKGGCATAPVLERSPQRVGPTRQRGRTTTRRTGGRRVVHVGTASGGDDPPGDPDGPALGRSTVCLRCDRPIRLGADAGRAWSNFRGWCFACAKKARKGQA